MSAKLEAFLAKLYVDADFRARFLAAPQIEAAKHGLAEREIQALVAIDKVGLKMASASVRRKAKRRSGS